METKHFRLTLLAAAVTFAAGGAQAEGFIPEKISNADGIFEAATGVDVNETEFMKNLGLTVGGWVDFGYTHNFNNPKNNLNTPITFNWRDDRALLNQINVFVERAVATGGDSWDIGGRVDFMYGSDSPFTQATGLEVTNGGRQKWVGDTSNPMHNINKMALPQFYLDVYAPVFNGVTAKLGHFYTIIGNEVVTAPDNFFYSHAYTMQYGEPFTHTGALFSTPITDSLSITVGAVNGWDNFSSDLDDAWNFIGGLNWGVGDLSVAMTAITGAIVGTNGKRDRSLYSIVLGYDITDNLHFLIQHDHGWEDMDGTSDVAHWYGVNGYLTYDINDMFAVGTRLEWFRDDEGVRVLGDGRDTNFYEMTAGVNFTPVKWFKVRPEFRYDWANGSKPYDDGQSKNQLVFAVDAIVMF